MITVKLLTLSLLLLAFVVGPAKAQLPDLPNKPLPDFDMKSFCPPMGSLRGKIDPERNKMKNRIDGRKTNVRFRSAETVERVRLDTKDFQYLYHDGDMLVFMDKDTYEQISLPRDLLGDAADFLQDGMDVVMELYNEKPISVQLPDQVEATIVEADAVVKGQTASSSYKPAVLDNGVKVLVPPHISAGTKIVVDVYNREYVRRAD